MVSAFAAVMMSWIHSHAMHSLEREWGGGGAHFRVQQVWARLPTRQTVIIVSMDESIVWVFRDDIPEWFEVISFALLS